MLQQILIRLVLLPGTEALAGYVMVIQAGAVPTLTVLAI